MEYNFLKNEEENTMNFITTVSEKSNENDENIAITNDAYKCKELSRFLDLYGFKLLDGISSLNNGTFRFMFNTTDGCLGRKFSNIETLKNFFYTNGFNNVQCKCIKLNLPVNANNQYYEVIIENDCNFFTDSKNYMHIPEYISNKVAKKKKLEAFIDGLSKIFVFLFLILILLIVVLSFVFKDKSSDFESQTIDSVFNIEKIEEFESLDKKTEISRVSNVDSSYKKYDFQYYEYDIEVIDSDGKVYSFPYSKYEVDGNNIIIQGYSPEYYRPVSFMVLDKRNVKTISGKCSELGE